MLKEEEVLEEEVEEVVKQEVEEEEKLAFEIKFIKLLNIKEIK